MRASIFAFVLASLSAGCAGTQAMHDDSPHDRRVRYACDSGETVEVRFFPAQGVAVLVRGGATIELQQQPAGSGFAYGNGPNTIRGKGDALTLEIGRRVPIQCTAQGPASPM